MIRHGIFVLALLFATLLSAAEVKTYDDGTTVWYYSAVTRDGVDGVQLALRPEFNASMEYTGEVVVPETIQGLPVIAIDQYAFKRCSATSITLPESVTYLSSHAFDYASSLETISLSPAIKTIGIYAFSNCPKLKSVELPRDLEKLGGSAFFQCTSLEEVTVHKSLTKGETGTFPYCKSLKRVYVDEDDDPIRVRKLLGVPSTVQVLRRSEVGKTVVRYTFSEDGAHLTALSIDAPFETLEVPSEVDGIPVVAIDDSFLEGCSQLKSLILPDSIVTIGKKAFAGCSSLESVRFSSALTTIGDYGFRNCGKLSGSHALPNVTALGSYCFELCGSLETLEVPKLTEIPYYGFRGCTSLESVALPEEIGSVGVSAFEDCTALRELRNVKSIKSVSMASFKNCSSLETPLVLRQSCAYILSEAFKGCSKIKEISLPAGVLELDIRAFENCSSLTTLYLSSSLRLIYESALNGCTNLKTIVVDPGTEDQIRGLLKRAGYDDATWTFRELEGGVNLGMWDYNWHSSECDEIEIAFKSAPEGEVVVPATLYGHKVVGIGDLGPLGSKISRLVLPESITSLSASAFTGCTALKEIVFLGRWPDMGTIFPEPKERFEGLPRDCIIRAPPQQLSWKSCVQKGWYGFQFEYLLRDETDIAYLKNKAVGNPKLNEWYCYVTGVSTTARTAEFEVMIDFDEEGLPQVSYQPDLGSRRAYTLWGSRDLKTWAKLDRESQDYRFYKVSVDLP